MGEVKPTCNCPHCKQGFFIWFVEQQGYCPWCKIPLKIMDGVAQQGEKYEEATNV